MFGFKNELLQKINYLEVNEIVDFWILGITKCFFIIYLKAKIDYTPLFLYIRHFFNFD